MPAMRAEGCRCPPQLGGGVRQADLPPSKPDMGMSKLDMQRSMQDISSSGLGMRMSEEDVSPSRLDMSPSRRILATLTTYTSHGDKEIEAVASAGPPGDDGDQTSQPTGLPLSISRRPQSATTAWLPEDPDPLQVKATAAREPATARRG